MWASIFAVLLSVGAIVSGVLGESDLTIGLGAAAVVSAVLATRAR